MKKIIGVLVGAIIIFMGGFMSWSMMGTFEKAYHYSDNQQAVLEALAENLTEEGVYYMPQGSPSASQEEKHAAMEANVGKPTATVIFSPAMGPMEMGPGMAIGFVLALLNAWLVLLVVGRSSGGFVNRWLASLILPAFALLTGVWTNWNWMELPYHHVNAIMMDMLVIYGIAGLWFAWWAGRGQSAPAPQG